MPASRRGAALVALILCLLPAAARADDLLVMPYACSVVGGRMALSRGPEVGHRILGPREERRFTACSPVNPNLCRQWTVYRFDLDCDGERVPWVSVVAAAGAMERSARLVNGRLQVRMPPRWSLSPDDPCAEEPNADDRYAYRRMRRYCSDRMAMAPPVVEMPPGFAPMLNLDGIFVRAAPKVMGAPAGPPTVVEPPADSSASGGPVDQAAESSPWRPQAQREPPVKEPFAQAPPKSAFDPRPVPNAGPVPQPPAAEGPKGAPPSQTPPAPSPQAAPTPPPKVAMAPPVSPKEAPPTAGRSSAGEPERNPVSLNLFTTLRPATAGAIVVFTGLALGLLTAFAVARRRERLAHAGTQQRDFASLSFDDPHADEGMPRTRAQALQVLGMAPSANLAAIKKIVDGLRVSWHPDLATDEADRQLRELRSKQINAAWEILQRQRTT
jgi:hypothetical protein